MEPTKQKSKLEWIAQEMRAELARHGGTVTRELARGLRIELSAGPGRWLLKVSRPVGWPSGPEMAIVRQAFGVAEHAEERADDFGAVYVQWKPA